MRILSGVQPSGKLHLGNYFGAIKQHLELQHQGEAFYFIADYHALTTVRDAKALEENTRDVAVLVYYADRPVFSYQARFERGEMVEFDANGQFVVTEVPRFFKIRIDSDLSTPYGDPMQGMLIYLNQSQEPGIIISTLGLLDK